MNDPITWGDYFWYKMLGSVLGVVLSVVLGWLVAWSDGRYCKSCARELQWRWRKPHPLASRKYCPFHDDQPW